MTDPSFIVLYVDNPATSAAFYAELLDKLPVEAEPNFALFELASGAKLGLWSRADVRPEATIAGGSCELVIALEDADAVEKCYRDWRHRGLCVIQPPTDMVFGRNFVILDPDGHRLRVFTPAA
jgi:predicted enzyme related to lactoylglutathione lyase